MLWACSDHREIKVLAEVKHSRIRTDLIRGTQMGVTFDAISLNFSTLGYAATLLVHARCAREIGVKGPNGGELYFRDYAQIKCPSE